MFQTFPKTNFHIELSCIKNYLITTLPIDKELRISINKYLHNFHLKMIQAKP